MPQQNQPSEPAPTIDELARDYGPDHPRVIAARLDAADGLGEAGDPVEAARLYEELIADCTRIGGPDHEVTLVTRNDHANWVGKAGDPARAADLFEALAVDMERVYGPDDPNTLAVRAGTAGWQLRAGRTDEAARIYDELVPDLVRVLGDDDPQVLDARAAHAAALRDQGRLEEAVAVYELLLPAQLRVLGPDDESTGATRSQLEVLRAGASRSPAEGIGDGANAGVVTIDQDPYLAVVGPGRTRGRSAAGWAVSRHGGARTAARRWRVRYTRSFSASRWAQDAR